MNHNPTPPPPSPSDRMPDPEPDKPGRKKALIIGGAVGAVAVLAAIGLAADPEVDGAIDVATETTGAGSPAPSPTFPAETTTTTAEATTTTEATPEATTAEPDGSFEYCGETYPADFNVSAFEVDDYTEYCEGFSFGIDMGATDQICDEWLNNVDSDILGVIIDSGNTYDRAVGLLDSWWYQCPTLLAGGES